MNAISWISKEAKRLRRIHPGRHVKYTGYVKDASAEYRKRFGKSSHKHKTKKLSGMGTRKTTRRRKAVRAVRRAHKAEGRAIRKLATIGSAKTRLKNQIEKKLGAEYVRRDNAKLKRQKKKISKKISEYKRDLRFLTRKR